MQTGKHQADKPSLNLSPSACVLLHLSEPARSTRWNLTLQESLLREDGGGGCTADLQSKDITYTMHRYVEGAAETETWHAGIAMGYGAVR